MLRNCMEYLETPVRHRWGLSSLKCLWSVQFKHKSKFKHISGARRLRRAAKKTLKRCEACYKAASPTKERNDNDRLRLGASGTLFPR